MNLILIGYRATGKSSVGRLLSDRLQWPFVDTDDLIEAEAGQTIPEIVASKGWDYFRELEKTVIKRVSAISRLIIATGGGVVMDPENTARLRSTGFLVWLQADVDAIQVRLAGDDFRPPLEGADSSVEVAGILKKRRPFYSQAAHTTIDTTKIAPESVVEKIFKYLPDGFFNE
jgi:shikimate kinase